MPTADWIQFNEAKFDGFIRSEAKQRDVEPTSISLSDFGPGDGAAGLAGLVESAVDAGVIQIEGQQKLTVEVDGENQVCVDLGEYGPYTRSLSQVLTAGDEGPEALKAAVKYVAHLIGSGHADED